MTGGDDSRIAALPHLGGKTAVILFVFTLSAFVAESQLTQVRFSGPTMVLRPPLISDNRSMSRAA